MDLALTETQRMLLATVREFVEREAPRTSIRGMTDSADGFSRELWRNMAALGLPGMAVPESQGGSWSSLTDLAVVFEALGEGAVPSPLLTSALAAFVIAEAGGDVALADLLPGIASGERLVALALTEPGYGWTAAAVSMPARAEDDGYVLDGTKTFVPYAHVAGELLVVARTPGEAEDGLTLLRVPANADGVSIRRNSGWLGEPVSEVTFAGVRVPGSARAGVEGAAWPAIERALDRATLLLCASMVGGAQRVVDMSVAYAKSRHAFGVPIGTFQRVQDLVIAALNDADAMRWTTYEALWKTDAGLPGGPLAASMAKVVASEGFPRACENGHYVHAGVGMDLDYGLTHQTERSRLASLYLGDATHHKLRMARLLDL